ncbi:MAG: hypothetical protein LBP63_02890 [Prevotellaceae bacterium]|nr:hypothetical protein [Prevotellaceae bacterium]
MKKVIANILLIITVIMFIFVVYYALLERFNVVVVPLFLVFIVLGIIANFYSSKKENSPTKKINFQFNDYLIIGKKIILYTLLFSFLSIVFIIICRIRSPLYIRKLLIFSMLISAFFAQFILINKIYAITTKKIYSHITVFLLCYINYIFIYVLMVSILNNSTVKNYEFDSYMGRYWTIITPVFFVLLLTLVIIKNRKGQNNSKFVRLSIPVLLFCFPTIKSFIVDDRFYCCGSPILKASFDCIFPFGYSVISLFTKEYNICQEGYGYSFCYETRFNPEIFAQMFQHKWLFLHFITIILAIVFIPIINNLSKKYDNINT